MDHILTSYKFYVERLIQKAFQKTLTGPAAEISKGDGFLDIFGKGGR